MCEIHGGYLARVESAEEQTFIENLLQGLHGDMTFFLYYLIHVPTF